MHGNSHYLYNVLWLVLSLFSRYKLKINNKMRYLNGLNQLIATELSDLKHGEYMCTECNKVIAREQIIPNTRGQQITINSINFCSNHCRSLSQKSYDRMVSF